MAEFKAFEDKYKCDRGFKSFVDSTDDRTASFEDSWKSFQASYPKPAEF